MTTLTLTREEVRETAIRTLVTHEKMLRAGMATSANLLTGVRPALDAAYDAGWVSDDIHPAADRRYGQWLIAEADRRELGLYATTFDELTPKHRTHIGAILGQDVPAGTSPAAFIQIIQDAVSALPDTTAWAYDRAVLDLAAFYLSDAQQAEGDTSGLYRAADEALAALDVAA